QLYYAEWFTARATLEDGDGRPLAGFAWPNDRELYLKLRYQQRDQLALPPLHDQPVYEQTPYGRLKLVDVIDCAAAPEAGPHPYKEGGQRSSWTGARAYATWERGISVEEFDGRRYREARNNEFFGYRVGRGGLK